LLLLAAVALAGCETLGYYGQSVAGQLDLLSRRRPIEQLLADPATAPDLGERLRLVQRLRRFAAEQLALPAAGSYRAYAEVERDALVWSVVATPEFSLTPREWCFPVVGCTAYRGYFAPDGAAGYARRLQLAGWDVAVEPVPAYSTLGWFEDPLPSTVIDWTDTALAELLFHELAHQRVYAVDDSAFNEAYATLVAEVGVMRWLRHRADTAALAAWQTAQQRRRAFHQLLDGARRDLDELYARPMPDAARRAAKQEVFARLQRDYRALRRDWEGAAFDRWFARDLNNAHLASLATYQHWVPALRRLLHSLDGDLAAFHAAAQRLAALSREERAARLRALQVRAEG
jgi:predicted aminopeptidase